MHNTNPRKFNPLNAFTPADIAMIARKTFGGIQTYYRDANIPGEAFEKYKAGLIIQEKGHLDATAIESGLTSSTRYTILTSQHEELKSSFRQYDCWTFPKGCYFKVLDVYADDKSRMVTLLQIPEFSVPYFAQTRDPQEAALIVAARERFVAMQDLVPNPVLKEDFWRRRTAFPLGIDSSGFYFFQFDYQGQHHLDPLYVRRGFFKRIFGRK